MKNKLEKKIDWRHFFRCHPMFVNLNDKEISEILEKHISAEKRYIADEIIVRQGEVDKKVFLIGNGSVKAILKSKDNQNEIDLVSLNRGELFGEMALLEDKPRSATIKAIEDCALLQIDGDKFQKMVKDHPDIEFKILAQLSQRIRTINSKLLAIQQMDIDAKLELFDCKLNAQLKVFDAALDAAQTVFDQTNIRTNEVINSAERSQIQAKFFLGIIGTIISVLGMGLGWFGFAKYDKLITTIRDIRHDVEDSKNDINKDIKLIKGVSDNAKKLSFELSQAKKRLYRVNELDKVVSEQSYLDKVVSEQSYYQFLNALDSHQQYQGYQAIQSYEKMQRGEIKKALNELEKKIFKKTDKNHQDYTKVLWLILDSTNSKKHFDIKAHIYFMLLSNAVLVNKEEFKNGKSFKEVENKFEDYIRSNKGNKIKLDLSIAESAFKESSAAKKEKYGRIKKVCAIITCEF